MSSRRNNVGRGIIIGRRRQVVACATALGSQLAFDCVHSLYRELPYLSDIRQTGFFCCTMLWQKWFNGRSCCFRFHWSRVVKHFVFYSSDSLFDVIKSGTSLLRFSSQKVSVEFFWRFPRFWRCGVLFCNSHETFFLRVASPKSIRPFCRDFTMTNTYGRTFVYILFSTDQSGRASNELVQLT